VRRRSCPATTSGAWISGSRQTRGCALRLSESSRVLSDRGSSHPGTTRRSQECSRHAGAAGIAAG
jgi:hypothetical protein